MQTDFRMALRKATREDHEKTDLAVSSFDLRSRDGLVGFLAVHHSCFHTMIAAAVVPGDACYEMADMIGAIEVDLATLDASLSEVPPPALPRLDPLALDYVLAGSRLGTKVLRRVWSASADPSVRRASAYFSKDAPAERWQMVCRALTEVDADGARARRITADTRRLFQLFCDVAKSYAAPDLGRKELMG